MTGLFMIFIASYEPLMFFTSRDLSTLRPLGTDQELSPLRADSPWELRAPYFHVASFVGNCQGSFCEAEFWPRLKEIDTSHNLLNH